MAVVYSNTVKAARMQAVLNAIDGQSSAGKVIFLDAMNSVLCSITLNKPSGVISVGSNVVLTFTTPVLGNAVAAGTLVRASIRDGAGNDVVTNLTVGTTNASNVVLASVVATLNEPIKLNSITIQHG